MSLQVVNPSDTKVVYDNLPVTGYWSGAWKLLLEFVNKHRYRPKRKRPKFTIVKPKYINCGYTKPQLSARHTDRPITLTVSSMRTRDSKLEYFVGNGHLIAVGFEQHFACDKFIKLDKDVIYWQAKASAQHHYPLSGLVYPENTFNILEAETALVTNKKDYLLSVGYGIETSWPPLTPFDPYSIYTSTRENYYQQKKIEENISSYHYMWTKFETSLINTIYEQQEKRKRKY